ncbi:MULTISPECIES: AbrB/MazE/SpoVT family DNA-binding domain-containing protein [Thermus]|uniref:AbrB/MazE/SpoVT family DNA-binding domain-containing protein n=2 Tax=Thermus TaxID=270 RepID=A0A4Q9B6B4_9DEIN|nr:MULTISPECIES: AbrB/MazE/SpoVT family DNA-binding domain-containing protein [Thermus]TBH21194.1 AbrB/MazE/SpoVT family DNA-binding domain-containing protein [Thermus thermamylovorans]TFU25780.1 AbrB/MazE/SpoVT family DNA-binding domain-containing protein [Thermus tengchongensis]
MGQVLEKTHYVLQVGSKGRVVLPAEVRAALGVGEGERLLLTLESDGTVSLKPMRKVVEEVYGLYKDLVPPGVSLVEELIRERREEARREELE